MKWAAWLFGPAMLGSALAWVWTGDPRWLTTALLFTAASAVSIWTWYCFDYQGEP